MRDGESALFRRFEGNRRYFRAFIWREIFLPSSSFGVSKPGQDQVFVPSGPQGFIGLAPRSVVLREPVPPHSDEMNFEVVLDRDDLVLHAGRGGKHNLNTLFHKLRHGAFVMDFLQQLPFRSLQNDLDCRP